MRHYDSKELRSRDVTNCFKAKTPEGRVYYFHSGERACPPPLHHHELTLPPLISIAKVCLEAPHCKVSSLAHVPLHHRTIVHSTRL